MSKSYKELREVYSIKLYRPIEKGELLPFSCKEIKIPLRVGENTLLNELDNLEKKYA